MHDSIKKACLISAILVCFISSAAANIITIDTTTKYQTIDGFGWHGTMHLYWNGGPYYNDAWLALVIDTLGLTIERNAYDSPTDFTTKEKDALLAMYARAQASSEPLKFWLSVWSPPANLKSGGTLNGGSLLPSAYTLYGNWLVAAIQSYQTAGIPLYGVSPQNEPSVEDNTYSTCKYNPPATYIAMFNVVAPLVKASFPNVKILGSENCCLDFQTGGFNTDLLNDTTANKYLDIFAYHDYQGIASWAPSAYTGVRTMMTGRKQRLWETESGYKGDDITTAINAATEIHNNLAAAQVNAYLWWQGTGDADLTNFSLIDENGNIGKRFWALRQYYRFVRPGAVRIKATAGTVDADLRVTAFKRATTAGQENWAIVIINKGTAVKGIRLAGSSLPSAFDVYQTSASLNSAKLSSIAKTDSLTLPAQSVTTLVYGNFHGGIDISTGISIGDQQKRDPVKKSNHFMLPVRLIRTSDGISMNYEVSQPSAVRIMIIALDGRETSTIVDNTAMAAGTYDARVRPDSHMASGVFIIKATIGTQRMVMQYALGN